VSAGPAGVRAVAGVRAMADARGSGDVRAAGDSDTAARVAAAWRALAQLEDPELPPLTLLDLGIVRFVKARADGVLEVGISPTYTGCPATDYIRQLTEAALAAAQVGDCTVSQVLAPAWTSDWITPDGRSKLEAMGVVAPERAGFSRHRLDMAPSACPRCRSTDTECLSEFGSTPCKALHRCRGCLEPFERFKCI
jgi:ring-1,2-phenylacetyl-CoA epoxidase subunit PaaD